MVTPTNESVPQPHLQPDLDLCAQPLVVTRMGGQQCSRRPAGVSRTSANSSRTRTARSAGVDTSTPGAIVAQGTGVNNRILSHSSSRTAWVRRLYQLEPAEIDRGP